MDIGRLKVEICEWKFIQNVFGWKEFWKIYPWSRFYKSASSEI
jgi:hypothetical protein